MNRHRDCPAEMTLTAHCTGCGQVFEYLASILANGTTPCWCGPRCRNIAKRAGWAARHSFPCVACGGVANPRTRSHGVGLCASCQAVRWTSCQRKKRHPTQADAEEATWQDAPFWYPCPLCRGWHTTATRDMGADWPDAVAAIVMAIGRVEAEQGWVWLHPAVPDSRRITA